MRKFYLLPLFFVAACGTIFSGTSQDINFDSNVKGVSVYIDGAFVCKTPCIYSVSRASGSIAVTGKKDGYEDVGMSIKSKLNPTAFTNLSSVYSWTTDLLSGGAWKYSRDGVYFDMEKEKMTKAERVDVAIRRFALFSYGELKAEAAGKNGEYMAALSELSGKNQSELSSIINETFGEVALAHKLTDIE